MKDPLVLTIDIGTQSVRVALFDKKGTTVHLIKKQYEPAYFSPKPGRAEQDPEYYWTCLKEASRALMKKAAERVPDIVGVAMSCFRDSVVFLGEHDEVLRPAILFLDDRLAEGREKLPLSHRFLFALSGMKHTVDLNRQRSRAVWVRENEPEIWEKTRRFITISTYITEKLVGEYVDSPASMAGHLPIDFKKRQWYKNENHYRAKLFGVPLRMLCRLVPVGDVLGRISRKAALASGLPEGLPVFSVGSDKSCETLGLGAMEDTMASISYGTASSLEVSIKEYKNSELFLPSYPAVVPGFYNMELLVYRGYWMLNWFSQEFGKKESLEAAIEKRLVLDVFNEEMMSIPPGSDGLVLQPYWSPGIERPLAKGAIIGFSDRHTRIHLYRAIIEGIAYALREAMEFFQRRRLHHKITSLRVAGGGSQSDAVCQITADVFGLPVSRVQTYETSSLGAAIAGFLAAGEFKDVKGAIAAMVHPSKTFQPDPEAHARYDYLFRRVYLKMFPRLKGLYRDLKIYERPGVFPISK